MTSAKFVWKNLFRRPLRSALTISGISLGIAATLIVVALSRGFEKSFEAIHCARGADIVASVMGDRRLLPILFEQRSVPRIGDLPGVRDVAAMMVDFLEIDGQPKMLAYGWEEGSFLWDTLGRNCRRATADRSAPGSGTPPEADLFLGAFTAAKLGKQPGDWVTIHDIPFRVGGVFEGSSVPDNAAVVLSLKKLQELMGVPGKVNFLNLRLDPGLSDTDIPALRSQIEATFPGLRAVPATELAESTSLTGAVRGITLALLFIASVAGALGVINSVRMNVLERTGEIGVLLALGWPPGRVRKMILAESASLCLAGSFFGIAGAVVVALLARAFAWLPPELAFDFGRELPILATICPVALGLVAALPSAIRAGSLRPSVFLRPA
jgi:putative ABC transport system permease protein